MVRDNCWIERAVVSADELIEVQDQRCLDIELLLSIIKDGRGFHLGEFILHICSSELT